MTNYVSSNWQYFFAPAAVATIAFGGSRLIAGTAGIVSKKIGEYATPKDEARAGEPAFVGSNVIGDTFKATGDKLIAFATRDSETEKKIAFGLVALGFSTYFTANMLYNEGQVVAPTPPASLLTKFTESVGLTTPPTAMEKVAATAERVVENVSEDPYLITSMPLGATIAGSLASRAVTGTLGTSAKVTSYAMNIIGLTNIGHSLGNTGDKLTNFATRNPRFELDAAIQIDTVKWLYSFF